MDLAPSLHVKVVCGPALAPAFALASVAVEVAPDAAAAGELMRRLARDPKVGMVLVDEALFRALPPELRARLESLPQPIIAPFPVPTWDEAAAAEAYVLEILRQAIGYRVRPR